jgi:cytoskeletal protein RodZ
MKWPFSRKKDVSEVPAEIQEYYQTEKRERTGVAWLLALGTLLLTIGLAAILFFGGRWAYRAIVDNDNDTQETAQNESEQNPQDSDEQETAPEGTPQENANAPASDTSSTNTSTPSNTQTANQGTAGSSTTQSTHSASNTPVTGDSSLPDTGPGDTLAIFVATVALASLAHCAATNRRTE